MSAACWSPTPLTRQIALAIAAMASWTALAGCGSTEAEDVQRAVGTDDSREFRSSPQLQLAAAVSRRGMKPGARDPFSDALLADVAFRDWKSIVLHHTATETGNVESIHAQHVLRKDASGRPWLGIGYHFIIGNGRGMSDGEIQPTFRWREQLAGAHAGERGYNESGIGVCLVGDFNREPPTEAQRKSLERLLKELQERFRIADARLIRHGDIKATACPGKLFDLDELTGQRPSPPATGRQPAGRRN